MQLLVLEPERDRPLSDIGDTTLRNGWPPYVATGVSQEMLFRLEGLNLDAPPTILLLGEHLFHLVNGHLCMKPTCSEGYTEKCNHGPAPSLHQWVTFIVDARNPGVGRTIQPSPGKIGRAHV